MIEVSVGQTQAEGGAWPYFLYLYNKCSSTLICIGKAVMTVEPAINIFFVKKDCERCKRVNKSINTMWNDPIALLRTVMIVIRYNMQPKMSKINNYS